MWIALSKRMSRILVVYASHFGQTRKIAERVAQRLRERGHDAELRDAKDLGPDTDLLRFGGVIVGGSVHRGSYPREAIDAARAHRADLEQVPSAFFSVSMSAASIDEPSVREERSYLDRFSDETGWSPAQVESFGGALAYTRYNFFLRQLMKWIARRSGRPTDTSRDHEFTDWEQVDRFADDFVDRIAPPAPKPRPLGPEPLHPV
jgi:menaquinone-dependent protoporphyrinogen oxidase